MSEKAPVPSQVTALSPSGRKLWSTSQELAYDRSPELREFARQLIAEERFWRSIVGALRTDFETELRQTRLIASDHPLLALGACAALAELDGMMLRVPMRRDEPWPTPDTLPARLDHVTPQTPLEEWLQQVHQEAAGPGAPEGLLLARTWGLTLTQLSEDWAQLKESESKTPASRLVAILRVGSPLPGRPGRRVFNVTDGRKRQLIARMISELGLPPDQPCRSLEAAYQLIQRLLAATDSRLLDDLLLALNTPDHHRFLSYVYQLERIERPETTALFRRNVLADGEDHPRHAAALFLASHFTRLSVPQFLSIGDSLVLGAPTAETGRDERRQPQQITDVVLKQCGVKFVTATDGTAYCVIDTGGEGGQEEPLRAAEVIRNAFDQEAPLLKERFIQQLARDMMLGHPSDNVAQEYRDLELIAMRRGDPQEASGRLVEIVFGHPALSGARSIDERELLTLRQNFRRIIARVPELIERVAKGVPALKIDEALQALSSAEPKTAEQDETRLDVFRRNGALIFLAAYAAGTLKFTLRAFPSLTRELPGDGPRVDTLLDLLVHLLEGTVSDPLLKDSSNRLQRPETIWRLLGDAASVIPDMRGKQKQAATLLVVVATRALLFGLRRNAWRNLPLPPPGTEVAIVRAVFDIELQRFWLREPSVSESDQDGLLPTLYLIARVVLEALVANASFQSLEDLAIDVWFVEALGLQPSADRTMLDHITAGFFRSRDLWSEAIRDQDGFQTFRAVIQRLLNLFPLIVAMAVARVEPAEEAAPVFAMPELLKQWLVEFGPAGSPLEQLRDMLDDAAKIRSEWRAAHDHWIMSLRDRSLLTPTFKERGEALRAFSDLIRPLLSQKRSRVSSARTTSASQSATQTGTE